MDPVPRETLRILMLEDDPGDAKLIRLALARTIPAATVRLTRTREEFVRELKDFSPQLVLSDYRLPGFDGLAALALVEQCAKDIPFILISGTIGEEMAVEALKSGATDYVLKNNLTRLEPVLTRALRAHREREELLRTEAALRESQARLMQSQKMESLGRLSGGVAHDFNNILTAITGYAELALLNPKLDEGLRADIQEILNAAFRAAALTRQLLAFSRRQIFTPKIMNLNHALPDLDRMLQRIIGEDIKLTIAQDPSLRCVRVDADQVGQVILNLVVNARDAMPKGGTLTLRTANVELGINDLRAQHDLRPGRYVRLSVEDSGVGMDVETLSHIFEPFFTTKSKDKGTGLGLATVYGIVKQSNGFIEVESRPDHGSVFRIYLPAVEGEVDETPLPSAPASPRGAATILVVDDDAAVGLVTRRILESQGYAAIGARGGEEALSLSAVLKKPLDLVMTDVVMAGMSGPELARRIKAGRPECRILFASGYAEGAAAEPGALREPFISKPFTVEALVKKVRQILEAPAPAASRSASRGASP